MEQRMSYGVILTAEQIPLLRDVIVSHNLSVFISDTQHTQLLDDQWKPWVRRVRPQRTHCPADVWLLAPCYSWPDQQQHPRIRQIIAEQLQICIQMAIMLRATGIVVPIEHADPAFNERIAYYLALIHAQLTPHSLTLMVAVQPTTTLHAVFELLTHMDIVCPLLVSHTTSHQEVENGTTAAPLYAEITIHHNEHDLALPTWAHQHVIGADDSISVIRQKLTLLVEQSHRHTPSEEQGTSTIEAHNTPESTSLITKDDEVA